MNQDNCWDIIIDNIKNDIKISYRKFGNIVTDNISKILL